MFMYTMDFGQGESQTVETNFERQFMSDPEEYLVARQMRDKEKWKSKAEEVEYEDC